MPGGVLSIAWSLSLSIGRCGTRITSLTPRPACLVVSTNLPPSRGYILCRKPWVPRWRDTSEYKRNTTQVKAMEKTVTVPTSSMVKMQRAEPSGSLHIESVDEGCKAPLGRSQKEGDTPIPPLVGGAKGVDGKARDIGSKRLDGWRTRFVSSRCFKMEDVVFPEDFPYELRLIIAREYRKATVGMRDQAGWLTVHRYLPCSPKQKKRLPTGGLSVPRHGNILKPVTGYFWRRMIRHIYAATDKRMLDWFNGLFRPDNHLRPNEACEWPIVHCHYCQDIHINSLGKEDEEIEWQKEQQAFWKKMRRVDNLKARRVWLTRLRPRPSNTK